MRVCTVCGSGALLPVIDIRGMPALCNTFFPSAEEARAAPRGDIELKACERCGHLFNAAFDEGIADYGGGYENSLHGSAVFRDYAEGLARRLVVERGVTGKEIVEIGCGQGEFLTLLCETGNNHGTGYDKAFSPAAGDPAGGDVTIVREHYGPEHAGLPVDFLCCRHVLEHLGRPVDFLSLLGETIGERECGVYFEVPDGLSMLRYAGLWDLIYEHPSFFWRGSFCRALLASGFAVDGIREEYGGQFLGLDGRAGGGSGPVGGEDPGEVLSLARAFGKRSGERINRWKDRLEEHAAAGRRVVLWGAGSKGVTFLNLTADAGNILFAVDVNPRKAGRFVPGSGRQVVPPEHLRIAGAEVVLVMNPRYEEEVRTALKDLAVEALVEFP